MKNENSDTSGEPLQEAPLDSEELQELGSLEFQMATYIVDGKAMSLDEMARYNTLKKAISELYGFVMTSSLNSDDALRRERRFGEEIQSIFGVGYQSSEPNTVVFYTEWAKQEDGLSYRADLMDSEAELAYERVGQVEEIAGKFANIAAKQQEYTEAGAEAVEKVSQEWNRAAQLEAKTAKLLEKAARLQRQAEEALHGAIETQATLAKVFDKAINYQVQAAEILEKEKDSDQHAS